MFLQTFCFCCGTFATCHGCPNKAAAQTEEEENQKTHSHVRGRKQLDSHVETSEDSSSDCSEESNVRLCSVVNLRRLVLISVSDEIQTLD